MTQDAGYMVDDVQRRRTAIFDGICCELSHMLRCHVSAQLPRLDQYGMDSMDFVDLSLRLSERFGVEFSDAEEYEFADMSLDQLTMLIHEKERNMMNTNRNIVSHQVDNAPGDHANELLAIVPSRDVGVGGAPHEYILRWSDTVGGKIESLTLPFRTAPSERKDFGGITNEALLAVVADRLECFQRGRFACPENQKALELIQTSMRFLHSRTIKRLQQGVEGKLMAHSNNQPPDREKTAAETETGFARLAFTNNSTLFIGSHGLKPKAFSLDSLKEWRGWQPVESALRALTPPSLTSDEWRVLDHVAEVAGTDGAKNGLKETKSALKV